MLNNVELQKLVAETAKKHFPEEMQNVEILIKNKNVVDLESNTIKSIILDFRLAYHGDKYRSTRMAYNSCLVLAETLKETVIVGRLIEIRDGKGTGLSIPNMEDHLIRLMIPKVVGKARIRIDEEVYSRATISDMLAKANEQIYRIFYELQSKYNIKEDLNWISQVQQNAKVGFDDVLKGV